MDRKPIAPYHVLKEEVRAIAAISNQRSWHHTHFSSPDAFYIFFYSCYFYRSYFSWTRSVVDTISAESDIRGLSFLKLFTVATGAPYISISVTANSTVPWIARLGDE